MVKKHNLVTNTLVKNIEEHIDHLSVGIKYYNANNEILATQFRKEQDFYVECLHCIQKYSKLSSKNKNMAIKKCIYYKNNMHRNTTYIKRYKLMRAIISYDNKILKDIEQIPF